MRKRSENAKLITGCAEGSAPGIIDEGDRGEAGGGELVTCSRRDAIVDCSCGRRDCCEAHASEKAILIITLQRETPDSN